MSCYLRHMKKVLEEAGISPQDKNERKDVDLAIRGLLGNQVEKNVISFGKKLKIG